MMSILRLVFLAVLIDLFSRRVVGWSVHTSLETAVASRAFEMARNTREVEPGLIHHTDRGVQYVYRFALAAWIRPVAALAGPVAPMGLRKRFDAVKARAGLTDWPQNAMRHSFGSYRLAACADAARVSLEMGNSPAMVFAHYRELVKPAAAAKYWSIRPALAANVVALSA